MQWIAYIVVPFLISVLMTPIIKWIAVKLEVYAEINERTVHKGKIARVGGVAIYIAFMCSMVYFVDGIDLTIQSLLVGCCIVFIGGLIDDMMNLKPILKFSFQAVATIILIGVGGVELDTIRLPFNIAINMGFISFIVTFIWVIGITNAINLIDGLDGLAGGVSAIILLTIASISFVDDRFHDIGMLSLILAGAILGFLIFNMHPASIFMGDCGALFLGFFIASISLMGFKSSTFITLGFPILLLAVPIIDTISAMLRRFLSGKSFASADKSHLHHVLQSRFGHRNTVLIIYMITIGFGIGAYVYIVNKAIGLFIVAVIFIVLEVFIEKTHMISEHYHPLVSFWNYIRGKNKKIEEEIKKIEDENKEM